MAVPMPSTVVLILCKTLLVGTPDPNASFTGYQNREWAFEGSMMVCRRQEVAVYDAAVDGGQDSKGKSLPPADPQPFNQQRCMRSGLMLGSAWDAGHKNSKYRFWRVACPTPVINTITKEIIAWVLPDCGKRDVVRCEVDTAI